MLLSLKSYVWNALKWPRSYLCARACSVNGSLASLIFKAHLKLIALTLTLIRGQKPSFTTSVELVFLNLRSF